MSTADCRQAIRLVAAAALVCCSLLSVAAESPARHALFVELQRPYESNRASLQKMLTQEGYESFSEREGEIVMVVTTAQIEKLFQARVRMRTVEKSASSGTITQPALESYRIPPRFEKLIRRVHFDPQRG
jgi:hypothetical protein